MSPECKQFLSDILKKNPEDRPSARQAYEYPWFKNCKEIVIAETSGEEIK
jgi:serine/threonine protein kinase